MPCDLFLLSWTITVGGSPPVNYNKETTKRLVDSLADLRAQLRSNENGHGKIINLLYTDISQQTRAADVALVRNGLVR
ncbi:MAG: hypothetical protein JO197_03795 [Acidobacteria bacterium]|nr:hypothetical protein [Acidobacteriota bacterium]MBV9476491.1 hypothetical protein [Acidobacteriota bacterium]